MVNSSHPLTDGTFHETGKRRQYVDRWVDLLVVKFAVDVDLPLGNVARQVRNGVSDVIVFHREDRDLGNGSVAARNTTSSLVDGGKVSVHVSRISSPARNLATSRRHFTQRICVRRHVSEDYQNMHLPFIGKILCRGQSQSRCNNPFNRRVICKVQEEHGPRHGSSSLEIILEIACSLLVHTHSAEDNGEVFLGFVDPVGSLDQRRVSTNLCRNLIVRKTSTGEQWDFLSASDRTHHVNSANSRLYHFLGILTGSWIDGLASDVHVLLGQDWEGLRLALDVHFAGIVAVHLHAVERPARPVEGSS
mmetsp:Transcript_28914/g.70484  ORF Transcript_28914/g.70484 Transcript_28914/m.70484 type:complete len:305 (+) Transcript_28914:751-1665(+)